MSTTASVILTLAWRNIWRNKTRSILIIFSVFIGLLAGIWVLSLYKGMIKGRVRTLIDFETGHIQLHHPEFKKDYHPAFILQGADLVLKTIRSYPEVMIAAPRTVTQGMLNTTTGSAGVKINGVDPPVEYTISKLKEKITIGEGFHPIKKNEIIIGKKLANKMKLKLGAKLVLTCTDSSDNLVSSAFRICGIYTSNNAVFDEWNVYVLNQTLNNLLLIGNNPHEIEILLKNDDDLAMVQKKLKARFPSILIESWTEISPETALLVNTVDDYSYIIIVIILLALAFGILNTMLMSVLERTREIGMMVALGTSRLRIFLLILLETILLSMAGTPFGLLASFLSIQYFENHGLDLSAMGKDLMESFGFTTVIYPSFPWEKMATVMVMVLGTAVISFVLPVLKALKLNPVEALRR